jgi:DNA-directed RNA polymerase specialized sigma24 family protein
MDDHALVEALRSRAPEAPAALYDAYAGGLYRYCWFRLCDCDAAQAALCEALILAEAHIGELRDAGRLGPWLYAMARLECDRREAEGGPVPEPLIASHDQDDVDQRIVAWRAVRGMPPLSQEILELRVRHRLPVPELGAVLGLPVRDAQHVLTGANADLQEALTAELLVKEGPYGCSGRASILRERRGELTAPMRRMLLRHAQECEVCGRFRRRSVSPVKVYGLLPEATPPDSLRARVLSCFEDPARAGYRRSVATRTVDFNSAFPVQRNAGTLPLPRLPGADAAAVTPATGTAGRSAGRVVALVTVASTGLLLAATLGAIMNGGDRAASNQAAPTALPPLVRQPIDIPDRKVPQGWAVDEARASPTWPLGATGSAAPPTARPASPKGRGFEPGAPGRPGGPGGPEGSGTLAISPHYLDLGGRSFGSVELLAQGGPVDWWARTSGRVRLSRTSGRLDDGRSTTLWLWAARRPGSSGQEVITFQPGRVRVVVTWRPWPRGEPRPGPVPPSSPVPDGPSRSVPSVPPSRPDQDPSSDPPSSDPPSSDPPEEPAQPPSDPPQPDSESSTVPEPLPSSGPSPAPEPPQT